MTHCLAQAGSSSSPGPCASREASRCVGKKVAILEAMSTTEILARLAALSPEDRALIRDRLNALDGARLGASWTVEEEAVHSALTPERIVSETSRWPADAVAELVARLLVASHGVEDEAVDAAWRTEVRRRVAELESGEVQAVPLEESLAKARKLIGR